MRRSERRIRIDAKGGLEIIDPGLEDVVLLHSIDSTFRVRSELLPLFIGPRLLVLRERRTGIEATSAGDLPLALLWEAHDAAMRLHRACRPGIEHGISVLALKSVIAERLMTACVLCARRCRVDRAAGATGACGLAADAYVAEHFVHVAEEAAINPSLVLALRGCALRCRGCQQHKLLDTRAATAELLTEDLWRDLAFDGARSVSFVGGNPDESLAAVLRFLLVTPEDFGLPIVWNNHAYMSDEAIRLLAGVVDCYVPDLKFDRDTCARTYAKVPDYGGTARMSIARLLGDGVPVIVRILMVPGHAECCHIPSLAWLARQETTNLQVSLRTQYAPDWRITALDGPLAGRVSADEVALVESAARVMGLALASAGDS